MSSQKPAIPLYPGCTIAEMIELATRMTNADLLTRHLQGGFVPELFD